MRDRSRRGAALSGAAAAFLALLVGWLLMTRKAAPEEGARPAPPAEVQVQRSSSRRGVAAPRDEPGAPLVPIVDAIEIEKEEVCEGEENLVTVRAHTAGGIEDTHLHATIGGLAGMSVPLIASRSLFGDTAAVITVFGRDNVAVTVPLPRFRVKDCVATRTLSLERRLLPNTEAELAFTARLIDLESGSSFVPEYYRWDFGDGTTAETAAPRAVHDYGGRPQQTLYSTFVVVAEARTAAGETVAGRTSLALRNKAFVNREYAGVITLRVRLEPRFPVLDDEAGVVTQSVRLWHDERAPVRVRRVAVQRNFADGRRSEVAEVDAAVVLGSRMIPPAGLVAAVRLDTRREPQVFSIDYQIEGESADGVPVRGFFSVLRPPPAPTPENSTPVHDPLERARIRRAMSILRKPYVSQAEMEELEEQGAFADLAAALPPPRDVPPPRYRDVPKHPPRADEPSPDTPLPSVESVPVVTPAGDELYLEEKGGERSSPTGE